MQRPVGQLCLQCDEPIGQSDDGLVTMVLRSMSEPATREPVHAECQLRSVVGSLAHLEKRCSCYGGTDHETPGLTRRQEAIAVENWTRWHGLS